MYLNAVYFALKYMGKYGVLASSALMFNVASFSSLLYTVHSTCNTTSFNWMYLFGNTVAQLLMITYGVANKAPEIYVPTLFLFFGLMYIVFKKWSCPTGLPLVEASKRVGMGSQAKRENTVRY